MQPQLEVKGPPLKSSHQKVIKRRHPPVERNQFVISIITEYVLFPTTLNFVSSFLSVSSSSISFSLQVLIWNGKFHLVQNSHFPQKVLSSFSDSVVLSNMFVDEVFLIPHIRPHRVQQIDRYKCSLFSNKLPFANRPAGAGMYDLDIPANVAQPGGPLFVVYSSFDMWGAPPVDDVDTFHQYEDFVAGGVTFLLSTCCWTSICSTCSAGIIDLRSSWNSSCIVAVRSVMLLLVDSHSYLVIWSSTISSRDHDRPTLSLIPPDVG